MKKIKRRLSTAFRGSSHNSKNHGLAADNASTCLANDIDILHVSRNQHGSTFSPNYANYYNGVENSSGNMSNYGAWNMSNSIGYLVEKIHPDSLLIEDNAYHNNNLRHNNNFGSQYLPKRYSSYNQLTQADRLNANYGSLNQQHIYIQNTNNNSYYKNYKQNNNPTQGLYYPQQLAYQKTAQKMNDFSKNKSSSKNSLNSTKMSRPASIAALSNSSFSFLTSQQDLHQQPQVVISNISVKSIGTDSKYSNNDKKQVNPQPITSAASFNGNSENFKPNIIMRSKQFNSAILPTKDDNLKNQKVKKERTNSWGVSRFFPSRSNLNSNNRKLK
uniref:Uncharacterized protein n=1 Tax=Rhabditophanes sp. KR3021 TaxID=114890 RepID=A0AC35U6E7_9BILA